MRFRLALFGARHWADSPNQRRSIRKTLRDAYDTASKAVHLGEIPDGVGPKLCDAQDLCRQGILKLLLEGSPPDWGDLILGTQCYERRSSAGINLVATPNSRRLTPRTNPATK